MVVFLSEESEVDALMERILFVDRDQEVLDGFQRVLYKMRKHWSMDFLTSKEDALAHLALHNYSALVIDSGAAGITGIEFLQTVRENFPGVARIVLSGSQDMKDLLDCFGAAHQFLLKPVEAQLLKNTLSRVMALMKELQDQELRNIITKIQVLPSLPELHLELVKAITTGMVKEIGGVILKDPAMAAKILQLVNSPMMGVKQHIKDIYHAVTLLGVDIIKALVLSLEVFMKFPLRGGSAVELAEIFRHCSDVAAYARFIAMEITANRKLGAYLLSIWGLPEVLVESVAYHHKPAENNHIHFSPAWAVNLADLVKRKENSCTDPVQLLRDITLPDTITQQEFFRCLENKLPAAVYKIDAVKQQQLKCQSDSRQSAFQLPERTNTH